MDTFVTVFVLLAMTALGTLAIHMLNSQHDERIAAFPYGRARSNLRTRPTADPPDSRGHAASSTTGVHRDHRIAGFGRFWPRRRARK
ncbi:hypothetical protein HRW07_23220 [Streptomyces lunaelactis]|uniref:hypothetical protein n=1 Tax=Streptomyces lunaelactis TaxID=1535768 RepID=UPI00158526C8|nr:hypothetical protein [Streptomyces lunaelactis]NUL06085.1 hypothetical protein [Streptomyces lunaelactis]